MLGIIPKQVQQGQAMAVITSFCVTPVCGDTSAMSRDLVKTRRTIQVLKLMSADETERLPDPAASEMHFSKDFVFHARPFQCAGALVVCS